MTDAATNADILNIRENIIDSDQAKERNDTQTIMQLMAFEGIKVVKASLTEGLVNSAAQEKAYTAQATSIAVYL